MNDTPDMADKGFEDILSGRDTPEAKSVLRESPHLSLLRYAVLLRGAAEPTPDSTSTRSRPADSGSRTNLLEFVRPLLSNAFGVAEEAVAEFLGSLLPHLRPSVLGAGDITDPNQLCGIMLSYVSPDGPPLEWPSRTAAFHGRPVTLRQLDRGPRLLEGGEAMAPVIRFNSEQNKWYVEPSSIPSSRDYLDRWFVIAAEANVGGSKRSETVVLQFKGGRTPVKSGPAAFAAAREGYSAESAQWCLANAESHEMMVAFNHNVLRLKAAFALSILGPQRLLFSKHEREIKSQVDPKSQTLFDPAMEYQQAFTHYLESAKRVLGNE